MLLNFNLWIFFWKSLETKSLVLLCQALGQAHLRVFHRGLKIQQFQVEGKLVPIVLVLSPICLTQKLYSENKNFVLKRALHPNLNPCLLKLCL